MDNNGLYLPPPRFRADIVSGFEKKSATPAQNETLSLIEMPSEVIEAYIKSKDSASIKNKNSLEWHRRNSK